MGWFSKEEKVPELPVSPKGLAMPEKSSSMINELPELPTFPNNPHAENLNREIVKSAVNDSSLPGENEVHFDIPEGVNITEEHGESMLPVLPPRETPDAHEDSHSLASIKPEISVVPEDSVSSVVPKSPVIPVTPEKVAPAMAPLSLSPEKKGDNKMPEKVPQKKDSSEPIFVRFDKFLASQKNFKKIQEKITDVEKSNMVRAKSKFSTYTGIIIAVNVLTFLGFIILTSIIGDIKAVDLIALKPATIIAGSALWTLITSMFMHAGFSHLFVNMFSLFFIGNFVEKLIGKKRFLGLYFGSGIFAGIFFIAIAYFTGSDLNVYAVGASGAIFGLGGLLAVLTPRLPVLVFFIIPMPMWAAMGFLLVVLWFLSLGLGIPIGNTAHLGGLLIGVGYGFYLQKKYPKRTKIIKNHFSR